MSGERAQLRLGTACLILRPLREDDARWVWELDQDPEVMRFISFGAPTPWREFEDRILPRMLAPHAPGPQYGFWAAVLREDPATAAGWFHLRPERVPPGDMELGYRLRRGFWGRGLATEGGRALVTAALGEWGLPVVVANTLEVNRASRRVMEKCGLRWERDFVYPESLLPGSSEVQRRAVRYRIQKGDPIP